MEGVFGLTIPLLVIVMSVLGGRTHWLGPAIGALLIVTLQDRLAASGYTDWNPIVLGAVLAVLVIVAPNGLYGRMRARPWAVLGALVVPIAAGYDIPYGDLQNWVLAGMLLASLVAVVPARWLPARSTRPPRPGPVPAVDRTTPPEPGPPGQTVVECRSVARDYGGVRALEDVSLEVAAGELVGLVGPNGSGKTTLVNLLAGATRPSRGTIVRRQDTAGLAPHRMAHAGAGRGRTRSAAVRVDDGAGQRRDGRACSAGPAAHWRARGPRPSAHLETVSLDRRADARPASAEPAPAAAAGDGERDRVRAGGCCCWTRRWPG